MKFTTDIERYYFACAKVNHYKGMMDYVNSEAEKLKRKRSQKAEDERMAYREDYYHYVRKVNFWYNVRDYFDKKIDFGKGMFYTKGYLFAR